MPATYAETLELAVSIELECAALYEVFAKRFATQPELVYFWRLYAEAERYHAATIRIHQATLAQVQDSEDRSADADAARAFLAEVKRMREAAERGPVDIATALRQARAVEEHSAELHGRTQFFRASPDMGELLQKMADEDRAHRDVLASAERKWAGA